jgi:hypothetical protein
MKLPYKVSIFLPRYENSYPGENFLPRNETSDPDTKHTNVCMYDGFTLRSVYTNNENSVA